METGPRWTSHVLCLSLLEGAMVSDDFDGPWLA